MASGGLQTSRRLSLSKAEAVENKGRYNFDRLSLRLSIFYVNETYLTSTRTLAHSPFASPLPPCNLSPQPTSNHLFK